MLRVRDIMTREVFTLYDDATLTEAAWALLERNVSGAPVSDGDHLVGVISKTDLVSPCQPVELDGESRVRDVMTPALLAVHPDDPALTAVRLMVEDNIHRVVVMENGELVGIVTPMDVCKAVARGLRIDALEQEQARAARRRRGHTAPHPSQRDD